MQTIAVPAKTFEKILSRLEYLTLEIETIKAKLFDEEPPYGSDKWWAWSNAKALEDIKAGRYTKIHNKKELREHLNSLKTVA